LPAALALGGGPSFAGDDGAAPLWVGVGSIFGLTGDDNKDSIDYREHGRIVLPPKITLPAPSAPSAQNNSAWPTDPDVQRAKQEKEKKAKPSLQPSMTRWRNGGDFVVTPNTVVTTSATAGQGPGGSCAGGRCKTGVMPSIDPLGLVGLGKTEALGPEPDREWLTDPPKGFRAPLGPTGQVEPAPRPKTWKQRWIGSASDTGSQ